MSAAVRSLARAQAIVAEEGGDSTAQGRDGASEDRLGTTVEAHRAWLRSAPAADIRGWARDWAASS